MGRIIYKGQIMPRQSKCAHLQPAVEELFRQGKSPHEVVHLFSDLPLRTAKDWYSRIVEELPQPLKESTSEDNRKIIVLKPSPDTSTSHEEDLNDIEWVKKACKNIFRVESNNAIRIQALNCFLKAVQLSEPKEPEETHTDASKYRLMDSVELAALYKQMLN